MIVPLHGTNDRPIMEEQNKNMNYSKKRISTNDKQEEYPQMNYYIRPYFLQLPLFNENDVFSFSFTTKKENVRAREREQERSIFFSANE